MENLKVAIVGCGRISASYADAFRRLGDVAQLVLAVDRDAEKAQAFAASFGCAWAQEVAAVLAGGIDVVHLCVPHDLHAPLAVRAMRGGVHVLTEKPIAITLQQADEMIRVQRETGVKLGVIFQTRFIQGVETLRGMIAAGRFGKILSARSYLTWNRPDSYYAASDWKGTWDREGGGVLIDQAIHSIDRVRYLLQDDVAWIEGSVHNRLHRAPLPGGRQLDVEDTADAAVQFQNGCLYSLYACNYYKADAPITIELQGEKGRCGLVQDLAFYELDGSYTEIRHTYGTASVGPSYWGTSHEAQLRAFYRAVQTTGPVPVDGPDARKTLEIVKGVYLSSAKGERVTLPFTDTAYQSLNKPRTPMTEI